ncbi:alpha-ribazole phosphatase/probable phosphoglycerate mutase [Halomonas campaniensis]|uniref:Alpha-ribazole phosphatase/probable phosphoglycerate mutase n=1 Tax=Halomonas campaniensis TaxID=213554 RepID=A0A7W5PBC5_9GAMM|nr:histidine phosphatase family protein [Halomonas campaniensis]MBB3331462.1 alpha-ribazole phosphatase/probable phosphoglycerate mutase [Halomonas campaniensis]
MRFPDADVTTLDLIRHGEPVGGRMLRGTTDHPLSERGWQQMRRATEALMVNGEPPWDAVVTSPLSRCRDFALWFGEHHDLPVITEPALAEMALGEWEGRTHAQVRAAEEGEDRQAALWADPSLTSPPGGETLAAFDARVGDTWQALLAAPPGKHLLVVCHLFVTNALLHQVLEQPLSRALAFDLPYAATCRIRHERHALGETSLVEWIGR